MGKKTIHGGLIIRGTLASGAGDDLLTIDPTTGEVGKISGTPLTTTLTAGSIFLGNASNVATATAVTGDVTINSSGVTAITAGVIVNADINASAAIAHSKMAALTVSRALVSDGSGVVSTSSVTSTELGYVSGVTSAIQTQLNAKQATITGGATTITSSDLTANRALISGTLGKVEVSTVTNTELGYLSGVTSAIQTQFSGKLSATISGAAEGDIIYYNGISWVNLARGTNGQTLQSTGSSINWASATANGIAAGGTDGQVLTKQSGTNYDADWETLTVAHISDITASAAELNLLDGVTATTTELNYIDGVTSNIQSQLGNKLSTALPHHAIFVGNVSNVASTLAAGSEGQVLAISSGTPTWTTVSSSGVTTIAGLDGTTKSANGAAISGANLYLQTADDTYPGLVSTGTQTFTGAKTFTGSGADNSLKVENTGTGLAAFRLSRTGGIVADWAIYNPSSSTDLRLNASGDKFYFTSAGNFGVGGSPTYKLDVQESSASPVITRILNTGAGNAQIKIARTGGTVSEWDIYTPSASTDLRFYNGADRLTVEADGDVTVGRYLGVGAAPTYQLDVSSGSALVGRLLHTSTSTVGYRLERSGGTMSSWDMYLPTGSTDVRLNTGSTDLFYFTSTGRLGIGGAPSHMLDMYKAGDVKLRMLDTGGANEVSITLDRSGGLYGGGWSIRRPTTSTALAFHDGGADEFTFAMDGTATGTNWAATSDIRLKDNIKYIDTDLLQKISEIGAIVCEYDRKDNGKHETGFIAQELLKIAPEYVMVPEAEDKMLAVDYGKMTALLFKGFQQLLNGTSR